MLRSSMHLAVLALAFFLALNVLALPLQTSHSSPTSLPLSSGASPVSDVHHSVESVREASATHTHGALAIDLLENHLQKRQIGQAVKAIVKGISKLISKIVEKVKAKRRAKKLKSEFTKSVVNQGRHDHPQFNWVICHSKHHVNFKGTKGVDWDHEEKNFEVNGKSVKYDVYFAREGEFFNQGGKGSVDWAYDGFYDVDRKSKGRHIIFKRPPGT